MGITITQGFQEILDESDRKPNKIWFDKGNEFYSKSLKSWLEKNDVKSIHNEGKCIVAGRSSRTLKYDK